MSSISGVLIHTLTNNNNVLCVAISRDSSLVASGTDSSDNAVNIWDARTGLILRTLSYHTDSVRSVAFRNQDDVLASVSVDNTIRLYDPRTGNLLNTLMKLPDDGRALAFSGSGLLAAGCDDNNARIYTL